MPAFWRRPGGVMKAVDTNVVVRYLTADHPAQAPGARSAIDGGDIFVSATVVLESEWVLHSVYGFSRTDVAKALRAFGGLPDIVMENPVLIAEALARMEKGMDFADALHLGAAAGYQAMLSFGRTFIEAAGEESIPVVEP